MLHQDIKIGDQVVSIDKNREDYGMEGIVVDIIPDYYVVDLPYYWYPVLFREGQLERA